VGDLVASAVHHLDRLVRSRAWREHWLTADISDDDLDATLWYLTRTARATAEAMDAADQANGHPELHEQTRAGQVDIAATTRALRADVARIAELADAAASVDATLAAADRHQDRLRRRDHANDQLTRLRAALADARSHDPHRLTTDDVEAAASIAQYTAQQLTP
jgi:pterin-4a-carbinolamine dehydratase